MGRLRRLAAFDVIASGLGSHGKLSWIAAAQRRLARPMVLAKPDRRGLWLCPIRVCLPRTSLSGGWSLGRLGVQMPKMDPFRHTGTRAHGVWLASAALVGFLVSFVGADLLALPRGWFVLLHLLVTGAFLALYSRRSALSPMDLQRRRLPGLTWGAVAAAFAVWFVVSQPGSEGPEGVERALAVVWLGLFYGVIDALLLNILPVFSTYRVATAHGWLQSWRGRFGAAVLALCMSLLVTFTYHLGFPEFRGAEIVQPLIGNAVFTLAYILSGSPLAALLSHVALHVAATVHAYGTSVPLPPHY